MPDTKLPKDMQPDEFDSWLSSQVDSAVEKRLKGTAQETKPTETVKTEPIKVKLGENEYKFDNQEQLNVAIENLVANYNAELKKVEENAKKTTVPDKTELSKPKFDNDRFAEKFMNDVPGAIEDALAARFGFDNPVETLKTMMGVVEDQRRFIETMKFQTANSDFPMHDPRATSLVGQTLQSAGLPPTAEGLNAAWALIKQSGQYKVPEKNTQTVENTRGNTPAPPSPDRKTAEGLDYSKIENMTLAEVEALAIAAGLKRG